VGRLEVFDVGICRAAASWWQQWNGLVALILGQIAAVAPGWRSIKDGRLS